MHRSFVLGGAAILAAIVAIVLLVHGTDDAGLHAAIRATARTSALCAALAFARIRPREFGVLLPVSQALHYALILIAGVPYDATSIAVGVVIFAFMLWNAIRPNATALYVAWIAFVIAMGINAAGSLLYPAMTALLLLAGIVRWTRRPRARLDLLSS